MVISAIFGLLEPFVSPGVPVSLGNAEGVGSKERDVEAEVGKES